MIWGDGSPFDTARGVFWILCNVAITWYYCAVIGRRLLTTATGLDRRIWGSFIFACGTGHLVMVAYMALWPTDAMLSVLVLWDFVTAIVSMEAGHRSPDVPR